MNLTFAWWHVLVALLPILPNLWSVWHICRHEFSPPEKKLYWLLLAVFVPVIGGVIYIFIGRKRALPQNS